VRVVDRKRSAERAAPLTPGAAARSQLICTQGNSLRPSKPPIEAFSGPLSTADMRRPPRFGEIGVYRTADRLPDQRRPDGWRKNTRPGDFLAPRVWGRSIVVMHFGQLRSAPRTVSCVSTNHQNLFAHTAHFHTRKKGHHLGCSHPEDRRTSFESSHSIGPLGDGSNRANSGASGGGG